MKNDRLLQKCNSLLNVWKFGIRLYFMVEYRFYLCLRQKIIR